MIEAWILALIALLLAIAALLIAWSSRRISSNLAHEMIKFRDRIARVERSQAERERRERLEREAGDASANPDAEVAELALRIARVETQLADAVQDHEALVASAGGSASGEGASDLRDLVRSGLRRQGYRRVYVLDVNERGQVIVEVERGGITQKGTAWVEPDGQVTMQARASHRAFP